MAEKTYLSNDFLNKYMAETPTAYMMVYICAQKLIQEGKTDFSASDLASCLGMTENDVNRADEFWNKKNLPVFPKKPEIRHIPSALPDYSDEEINYYLTHNDDFRSLLNSAEGYMGKLLSIAEIRTLYSLHDWLRLPLEVIEILLAYCCENGHRNMRYIEKVAISWADDGVKDAQSALEHINKFGGVYMRIMKALGISKEPIPKQKEYMKKWSDSMPMELILYGCEKTALIVTNGNPFPYADKIFENWKKNGIDTVEKAKKADEKFAKNKRNEKNRFNYEQRSWDFDRLEQLKREELKKNLEES